MARWKVREPAVTFEDVPEGLTGRALGEWLEQRGLALVDFLAWKRARGVGGPTVRPPARRKLLSPAERAILDDEREREGPLW